MNIAVRRTYPALILLTLGLSGSCSDATGPRDLGPADLIVFQSGPWDLEAMSGDVYTMAPDGSELTRLTFTGDALIPAWSPDGTQIAFSRVSGDDVHLFVMDFDGSDLRQVTAGSGARIQAKWSPDGGTLIFSRFPNSSWEGDGAIYTVPVEGGTETLVSACDCQWPAYSPDGTKVAYAAFVPEGDDAHTLVPSVHLMNADGTGGTNLLPQATWGHRPAWSPDGTKIVFPGFEGSGPAYDIYTIAPDGTGLTRVTTTGHLGFVSVSPDGSRMVVEHQATISQSDIYVMNADGTGMTKITEFEGINSYPGWRPTG